ncbi:C2H2-type zinc finger transcription factor [Phycomyces blakesleeanus NRRL 1555(-)]|uniref:C2H2-type zinc finger transcription factor n=1 Tax=Phycomyces blakesleeanus (strain ATCC 8743b / DSM 1359 / FGSC 10004 / NBRC 33097 / NRRL 1555) TaxID=763407 RepID=A0A167P5L4_PHYB8|nr:C2H2-type zinc finger transcription factor [Phycomyces blakesleeanus NRRL 1555(-)]OAD77289.1 C2H2-type zinc finger transcription factor [Phycomyces blakesleeanus NRRL 1555(-)]|eukprot:XP_018295329.1 C2H2-type zinc finger transcription factor [Phycomyces blakesleeanus NRRL 1555(-)]
MPKTIYRFRVNVPELTTGFRVHLYAYQNKYPSFSELTDKIKAVINETSLENYSLTLKNDQGHYSKLHNNSTFQNALKLLSNQSRLEVTLHRNEPGQSRYIFNALDRQPEQVPIIKPTVLRWDPSCDSFNGANADRKDSGVSIEESGGTRKKRVQSADPILFRRTLPDLSFPPQTRRLSSSFHPLDPQKPLTAPSSPDYSRTITLPAISSLTSAVDPTYSHLAPILPPPAIYNFHQHQHHHQHQHQQNKQISQSSRSTSTSTSMSTSPPLSVALVPTTPPPISSQQLTLPRHNLRYASPGQFVCEHPMGVSGRVCGQTFRRSYDLSRHQTIHLKNRPLCRCHYCGKKFTRMDALRRHERVQGHTKISSSSPVSSSSLSMSV